MAATGPFVSHPLRALSLKQLEESQNIQADAPHLIDGSEVSQIEIIGCIRSVREQSTCVEYIIEDGTGSILCRAWPDKVQNVLR